MEGRRSPQPEADAGGEAFIRDLLDRAARVRMPELFHELRPETLYHLRDREGLAVTALRTRSLDQDQLVKIMTYRLAQYVAIDFVDRQAVYEKRLEHEPLDDVSPDDVHVLVGSAADGEIHCYMTIRAAREMPPGATLRSSDRPLFPVENLFGHGVFDRLRILPDLPVSRVRELGRFVKNQRLPPLDERSCRAPVEAAAAVIGLLIGPLSTEVQACIGDIEDGVVRRNMEYFHMPFVVLHGVVPYANEDAYLRPHVASSLVYPFAFLVSDLAASIPRLDAIDRALHRPGKQGVMALLALRGQPGTLRSSLEPAEGLPPLNDSTVLSSDAPMETRQRFLDRGAWLRATPLFRRLSSAEAAVLGTLLEESLAAEGEIVVKQGEAGDALYLIEMGRAEVQLRGHRGRRTKIAELGPGDHFGEIALVTGGEHTADVVARAPLRMLRLSAEAYARYLGHLVDVERELTRSALERTQRLLRLTRSDE
jgi:hypothetical protein